MKAKRLLDNLLLIVFLAGVHASPAALADGPAHGDLVGTWHGALEAGGVQLRIIFDVRESEGALVATMDSPDQGATDIPVESVILDGDDVRFDLRLLGAIYSGSLYQERRVIARTRKPSTGGSATPSGSLMIRSHAEIQRLQRWSISSTNGMRWIFRSWKTCLEEASPCGPVGALGVGCDRSRKKPLHLAGLDRD